MFVVAEKGDVHCDVGLLDGHLPKLPNKSFVSNTRTPSWQPKLWPMHVRQLPHMLPLNHKHAPNIHASPMFSPGVSHLTFIPTASLDHHTVTLRDLDHGKWSCERCASDEIYMYISKWRFSSFNILVLVYQRVNSVDPFRLDFGNGQWLRTQLDLPGCIDTLDLANTWWKIKRVGGTQSGYLEIRFEFLGINNNGNGNSLYLHW